MATMRGSALGRPVLLAGLVLTLCGAVCLAGTTHHARSGSNLLRRLRGGGGASQLGGRHQRDLSESTAANHWQMLARRLDDVMHVIKSRHGSDLATSAGVKHSRLQRSLQDGPRERAGVSEFNSASHWKTLSRRLNAVLRMMRSRQSAHASNDVLSSDSKPNRARRSYFQTDRLGQEAIAREIKQAARDAGVPSVAEKRAQEDEIVREIKQIRAQYGPAHKLAQQKEIARQIEEAEVQAGRAEANRKFEQQREIAREIGEMERKSRKPSDAERLEQQREIAREIEEIEAKARAHEVAQERKIAADIHAMVDGHITPKRQPDSSLDGSDSSPEYDDAFGRDSLTSPLSEIDDDDADSDPWPPAGADHATAPGDSQNAAAGQGHGKDAAPIQGHVQVAHSSWQVTAMTVVMCSIVGIVLLIVVGAWYRDLGTFRPGMPQNLLVDDDEQAVYRATTKPAEPRQDGRYSRLT